MDWKYLIILGVAGLALSALMCWGFVMLLRRREPYASFMRLRLRAKLSERLTATVSELAKVRKSLLDVKSSR